MASDFTIVVGTLGTGVWYSRDRGQTFNIANGIMSSSVKPGSKVGDGIFNECKIQVLTTHPTENQVIYAGCELGLFRSEDAGANFERMESVLNDYEVNSIAFDPADHNTVFVGARSHPRADHPGAIFRSRNGGQRWEQLPVEITDHCRNVGIPRITGIAVDPADRRHVWATLEVDGLRRSLDGGETWSRVTGLTMGDGAEEDDIHYVVISAAPSTTTFIVTPREIFSTTDMGESFRSLQVKQQFPMVYCRMMVLKPDDPKVMLVTNGDRASGYTGGIMRTLDRGETWEAVSLPVQPRTPTRAIAVHRADPDIVVCGSHYGELFCSENGGDSWRKIDREFSSVNSIARLPG